MPVYLYQAADSGGRPVRGRAQAETERELSTRLRTQGLILLNAEPDREVTSWLKQTGGGLFRPKVPFDHLVAFARQFAMMTQSGLPLLTTLRVLTGQVTDSRLATELTEVAAAVQAGESLGEAFARHGTLFPSSMAQMIAAGEAGGILEQTLVNLADQWEREEQVRQKVRTAILYPAIVLTVATLLVTFLITFIVPRFVELYGDMGAELPAITRAVLLLSGAIQGYWWAGLMMVAAAIVAWRGFVQSPDGALKWELLLLQVPVYGPLLKKQAIARWAKTLSGLLGSGMNLVQALSVVEATTGSRALVAVTRDVLDSVRKGQSLVVPLRSARFYPPLAIEMIAVGEESGTVAEMLAKVAEFFEREVQRSAERLSATLEPLLILVLGVGVGGILLAVILPIFSLWTIF